MRLFPNVYACCQNCGRGFDQLYRVRRFRVCAECYARIVPPFERAQTRDEVLRMGEFWDWFSQMEERYPVPKPVRRHLRNWQDETDIGAFYPLCRQCGAETPEYDFALEYRVSLFGKPRAAFCPRCSAEMELETIYRHLTRDHPEWDDEDCLDWLYQSRFYRAMFEIGVLPDFWFELRSRFNQTA